MKFYVEIWAKMAQVSSRTLTSTLANVYPSSNETSKKNGTVRGDCIACDALFLIKS